MSCLLGQASIACSYTLVPTPYLLPSLVFHLIYNSTDKLLTKLKSKPPRPVYEDEDAVNWYEVNFDKGVLEVTRTTEKGDNKIGKPKD